MIENRYQKERMVLVLDKGTIDGFDYCIVCLGTHPVAYVRLPKNNKYHGINYQDIEDIGCHWGLSFSDDDLGFNPMVVEDSWWIGWDYAHCEDWCGYMDEAKNLEFGNKKWTTKEILKGIKKVIKQLNKVNE